MEKTNNNFMYRESIQPIKLEKPEEKEKLRKHIQQIKNLHSSNIKKEYTSWKETETEPKPEKALAEKATDELLALLQKEKIEPRETNENEIDTLILALAQDKKLESKQQIIIDIKNWVQQDPKKKIELVEKKIHKTLLQTKDLNIFLLSLLGEINEYRSTMFIDDELAAELELNDFFSMKTKNQLSVLNQLNTPEANLTLQKMLDFVREYMLTVQNHVGQELEENIGEYYGGFFMDFNDFVKTEIKFSKNYLIQKTFQNILNFRELIDSKKEDALAGVTGSISDQIIYTFKNLRASYDTRLRLGINEGFPIANPVLPIAPGYTGYYKNGKLEKVFKKRQKICKKRESKYIEQKHSDDNYIYERINNSITNIALQHPDNPSLKLEILRDIWDFNDDLKSKKRKFFFDTSQIDMDELHPMVAGDILSRNHAYIQKIEGKANKTKPLSEQEFIDLLFPLKNYDESKLYHYHNLVQLHMRKKIEDNFGIDIANHNFWVQRNFLSYLENRTVDDVKKLQNFTKKYKDVGLIAFSSLEHGGKMGDNIIEISENLDKRAAKAIFEKYAQIVDQTKKVRNYLRNNFSQEKTFSEDTVNQIINNLLKKGRDLLADFSAKAKKQKDKIATSDILEELADIQTENFLFLSSFKELRKSGAEINFEDIKNLQFDITPALKLDKQSIEQMKNVYARNYEQHPDLQKELLADFDKAARNKKTTFYTLKHKDKIVAFNRFDILGKNKKRFAAFNVDPDFRSAKLGEAMMERSVDIESQNNVLEATCISFTPISSKYIETGFVAQELIDYNGLPVLKIEKDNKKKAEYAFKDKTKQEIIDLFEKEYKGKELAGDEQTIIKRIKSDQIGDQFEILNQGYNLTRYFREKGQAYLVFEKEKIAEELEELPIAA